MARIKHFPSISFEDALQIGNVIQEIASGEKVRRITLFDHMGKSPDSGPSRQLIACSHKYGITKGNYRSEIIELTNDGKIATSDDSPVRQKYEAKVNLAIRGILPFKFLYEKFLNNKLPSRKVMIDALRETDISDEPLAEECIDLFITNIKYLGLLKTILGNERIISIEHSIEELDGVLEEPKNTDLVPIVDNPSVPVAVGKNIENSCFYITPIGEEGSEQRKHSDLFFHSIIEPVVEKFKLQLVRADKISKPGLITNQIIEYLLKSKIVIADLSYHNPNVFYEIAIRHICRKPIVQIKRALDNIPFDIQQVRTISIDTTDIYTLVPKIETYKSEIASQIRSALENPELVDSPLTQHYDYLKNVFK
jgi:hypothetical protein